MDVLKQISYTLVDPDEHEEAKEKKLFEKLANLILSLEPDQLDDDQLEETIDILELLEPGSYDPYSIMEQDEDEPSEEEKESKREYYHKNKGKGKRLYPRTKKTPIKDRYGSRIYKRKNRRKIAIKKRKLMRSAEGRRRIRLKDRLESVHKTPTLRKKVRYTPIRKKRSKNRKTNITTPQGV